MTGKQFYYELMNEAGEYYYVDTATGEVKTTETETAIKDTPSDWGVMGATFGRDEELWGVFQGVSSSLKFRGDGKKILESIYYKNDKYPYNYAVNFEAFCRLIVKKRIDGPANTWNYETWYDGRFDFSGVVPGDEKGDFIQIPIIESTLKQIFDANRGTEYEIPITGQLFMTEEITMEGVVLDIAYEWLASDLDPISVTAGTTFPYPMGLVQRPDNDYFRDLIRAQTQQFDANNTSNTYNAFLNTQLDFTGVLRLQLDFDWTNPIAGSGNSHIVVQLVRYDRSVGAGSAVNMHTFYDSQPVNGGVVYSVSIDETITENFEAERYDYFIAMVQIFTQPYQYDVHNSRMTINSSKALPTTTCYALSYQNYAKLLIEKAFEGQATLSSQYLGVGSASAGELLYKYYDLLPNDLYITCGDALRQLSDPVIKGSLSDLIKDVYSRCMCGVGISGSNFIIEPLTHFMQKNVKIGTVRNTTTIKPSTAKSFIFNDIKVGYPEFRADDLNGRSEWNSTQDYKMGFKTITDSKDLTTPYKASVYEMEYLRSEVFSSGNTRDNANDNSIYLLYTNKANIPGAERELKKYTTGQIAGIPNPTSQYNIALSPKRNLLRHIPYLKSIMNIPDGLVDSSYSIAFIGGDRNTQLDTRINGAALFTSEYGPLYPAEVPQANSLPRLFLPLSVQFEALPQPELLQAIKTNPYGYLEVLNGSNIFGIFITDVEISGSDMSAYKFTGLLHPDSDTAQFVS